MNIPARKDYVVKNAYHHPAANTAAVVTISGAAGKVMVVDQIVWSFDVTNATAETLTIASPAATVLFKIDIPIPAATTMPAPQNICFPAGFCGADGEDVVVTLSAPAGGEIGKLNVLYH